MSQTMSFLELFNHLTDSVEDHNYCFVLGSGASLASGIPTGTELVSKWISELYERQIGKKHNNKSDLEKFMLDNFETMTGFTWNGRGEYYSRVYRLRYPTETDPAIGQNALSKLMGGKNPSFGYSVVAKILTYTNHRIVMTTNFDHLIEDSLHRYVYTLPQIITSEYQAPFALIHKEVGPPVIMKIHGDNYFATKSLDSEIETISKEWNETIKFLFQRYTPIIIGYGGHDPGFMRLLSNLPRNFFKHPPFWCYYEQGGGPQNPLIKDFLIKQHGFWVPTPDFDEIMLLFSRAFQVTSLEEKHKREQENHKAAWRREFEYLCERLYNQDSIKNGDNEPYKHLLKESIEDVLGRDDREKDWWQWHYLARIAETDDEKEDFYQRGIKCVNVPEPLIASHARYNYLKNNDFMKAKGEAFDAYRRAKLKYGDENPDTLSVRQQLARILDGNDNTEAYQHYFGVLQRRKRILGDTHPDTIASLRNLSQFHLRNNELYDAQAKLEEAIEIHSEIYGDNHWLTRQLNDDYKIVQNKINSIVYGPSSVLMIHQPHFFPWLGYFNKLINCDVFIALDNVQFRDGYYQNRTRILVNKNQTGWLTVPVKKTFGKKICETQISGINWKKSFLRKLELNYKRSSFYNEIMDFIQEITDQNFESIADIALLSISETMKRIGYGHIPIKRSSEITSTKDRTERIIDICESIGVSNLIYGEGGSWHCHDYAKISSNGIKIIQQQFNKNHPRYKQFGKKFIPNLSILDCLFHCGFEGTSKVLKRSWLVMNKVY